MQCFSEPYKKQSLMGNVPSQQDTALLVHIEHSKPIEISDFVSTMTALNSLYSSYVRENGFCKDVAQSKLYIEKIKDGCIDILLRDIVAGSVLPFAENANTIMEFSKHLKGVYEYFTKGAGEKPRLDAQDCQNLHDALNIVSNDQKGEMTIGAVVNGNITNVFNNCTMCFGNGNSTQNQLLKTREDAGLAKCQPEETKMAQLMTIYQMVGDMTKNRGNKAVISAISPKKIGLVFETDELKQKILGMDSNPTKKAFSVDVVLQYVGDRLAAYKVTALHDIISLEDFDL